MTVCVCVGVSEPVCVCVCVCVGCELLIYIVRTSGSPSKMFSLLAIIIINCQTSLSLASRWCLRYDVGNAIASLP